MGFEFIGMTFWIFLAAIIISDDIGRTKRRKADLELIRFAIEKGHPLDPLIVQQVLSKSKTTLFTGGVVTIAAGFGLIVFAVFLSNISAHGGWAVAGAGGIAICVGVGLVVSYQLTRRSESTPVAAT